MCTCTPGNTCWTHLSETEKAQASNRDSAHDHALVAVQEAERILLKGHPRVGPDVSTLETAVRRLHNYVAELKG